MAREERRRPTDVDTTRRMNEHSAGDRESLLIPEGATLFLPKKEGAYKIDIIPFEVSEASRRFLKNYVDVGGWAPERTYFTHAMIGVNNSTYCCPAKNCGQPCPICEYRNRLGPSKEEDKIREKLKPKERQLWLIFNHDEPDKKVQLWDWSFHMFGKHLDNKVRNADPSKIEKYKKYASVDKGYTLRLVATEKTIGDGGRKPLEFVVDEFLERPKAIPESLWGHDIDVNKIPRILDYDELAEIFMARGGDKKEEDNGKTTAATGGRAGSDSPYPDDPDPVPKKKAQVPDDDEPAPKKKPAAEPEPDERPAKQKLTMDDFEVGQRVAFDHKDDEIKGTVIKLDTKKELVHVQGERESPHILDVEEINRILKKKAPVEEEPEPAPKKHPPADEDEEPPKKRRPAADDDDEPAPKKKPPVEDDEEPPRKKRPADDDDEPAPKKKAVAEEEPASKKKPKAEDWDDDEPIKPKKKVVEEDDEPAPKKKAK